ncbi:MAG: OPT/YSL family transporter [Sphaerochaetaceae bacterium]|nr:OPT/YSL family transporter [Sphaerochaetaceae bacterium]MDY0372129.1 OPT/YSL family transporter [Sphaerochaetaceae bacterium]
MEKSSVDSQLTLRGLIIGLLGLIVITSSSLYVALRMGALPWPTVFVTVVSLTILRRFKNSSLQEINITHTIMSAGAMVAGGIAFTLPGIWMLNPEAQVKPFSILIITLSGALLGTLFTITARQRYIVEEQLPYPMGQAAYNTLIAGTTKGKGAALLFICMGLSALFTIFRDGVPLIPAVLVIFTGSALIPAISVWISPMAAGIGAIIGPTLSLVWLGGAVIGYLLLTPIGIATKLFADMAAADLFRQNLGIGLMVGTGVGILVKTAFQKIKQWNRQKSTTPAVKSVFTLPTGNARWIALAIIIGVLAALTLGSEITLLQAIVTIIGIYLTTQLAAMLTGQTGINPMEIFGILVLLAVQILWNPSTLAAFSIAGVTAVACGLTGDMMNDLKSGHLLGTKPSNQILAEGIGGIVGSVVAVIALFVLKDAFGGFGSDLLPAPQARAVTAMVGGLGHVPAFLIGASIGLALYLLKIPAATLGLGVYLPINISSIMGIGAIIFLVIRAIVGKDKKDMVVEKTSLVASGFLGGEGITGVLLAIIAMFA